MQTTDLFRQMLLLKMVGPPVTFNALICLDLQMYISLHAYGQTISYPPQSHIKQEAASTSSTHGGDSMYDMAHVAIESMNAALQKPATSAKDRQTYTISRPTAAEDARAATGRSDAYAMFGGAHIKYAYRIDLRDTGTHGFLLPPSNIAAAGRETFELVRGMVDYMWSVLRGEVVDCK